jgi:FKBP-type peptidyl-prolyl cis-trans isomerase
VAVSCSSVTKRIDATGNANGFEVHNLLPLSATPIPGCQMNVNYEAKFEDGRMFDKTTGKNCKNCYTFKLGVGVVVKGWEKGLDGIRVGDRSKLILPFRVEYGLKAFLT